MRSQQRPRLEQMLGMLVLHRIQCNVRHTSILTHKISLERLERTVAALLEKLGEDSSRAEQASRRPATALAFPGANQSYKDAESSAAPIMVIRDLATETGIKPSPDTRTLGAVVDELIAPDLALELITMYATHLNSVYPQFLLISLQFSRVLWSLDHARPRKQPGRLVTSSERISILVLCLLLDRGATHLRGVSGKLGAKAIRVCSVLCVKFALVGAAAD